jgi:hypothetical protein
MRSFVIITALVVQLAISASAQKGGKEPPPEPATGPKRPTVDNPNGAVDSNGQYHGEAIGVPGALALGQNPHPAKGDESIHFDDIAEALKTLVEKIVGAVGDSQGGSSSSTAGAAAATPSTTVMPEARIPRKATPCSLAFGAFTTCSAAHSGTFSAVATTAQAGCLCNVYNGFDFNANMQSCYSYAQNQTQYQSYASVIASATAACTCDPNASTYDAHLSLVPACSASSTTTSAAPGGPSGTTSGAGAAPAAPAATNGAAVRSSGVGLGAVGAAAVLGIISILH